MAFSGNVLHRRNQNTNSKAVFQKNGKHREKPPSILYYYRFRIISASALMVLVSVCFTYIGYRHYMHLQQTIVVTPIQLSKVLPNNATSAMNPDRFWGTYRPHVYFGLKARTPHSPVFGAMWLTQFTYKMPPPIRHWCDQGDDLLRYSWLMHDGKTFGVQELEEKTYTVRTEFVKRAGGENGGDWTARITLMPKNNSLTTVASAMFYIALDKLGALKPIIKHNVLTHVHGHSDDLESFVIRFPKAVADNQKVSHLVTYTPDLASLTDIVKSKMTVEAWDKERTKPYMTFGRQYVPKGGLNVTLVLKEVTAVLPIEMEVVFESSSYLDRPDTLQKDIFTSLLQSHVTKFNQMFSEMFHLREKGFTAKEIYVAKAVLSNMLGSVGYFFGSPVVQSQYNEEPLDYWPAALFTAVPSRPFFPRGFLWDEGFHNLLVSHWDEDMSMEIIGHWMDLINIEGWIPREMILGDEARAKVPSQFVVQNNKNANPPTFFLPLRRLVIKLSSSNDPTHKRYLRDLYPRLKAWYNWYNTSQIGILPSTYRWRGRDINAAAQLNPLTLTSGFDDYPRASHPSDDERHLDLRCWMALASDVMTRISKALHEDCTSYQSTYQQLADNQLLDKYHWSESGQQYSDYGLHSDRVRLEHRNGVRHEPHQKPPILPKVRVVLTEPKRQYVNAFGYVSLFPFLMKLITPDSPKLRKILVDIRNPGLLWTNFGLRSLAPTAKLYNRYNTEHDPPYWRGAIWININYLALDALHHYSHSASPHAQIAMDTYRELRENIINNMVKEFYRTGYVWENYSDKTGKGMGSHPFTGWSSLLVLIMGEIY